MKHNGIYLRTLSIIAFCVSLLMMPGSWVKSQDSLPDGPGTYTVKGDQAINARSCPRLTCDIVTTFGPDDELAVIETVTGDAALGSNLWHRVRYQNADVYVSSALVAGQTADDPQAALSPKARDSMEAILEARGDASTTIFTEDEDGKLSCQVMNGDAEAYTICGKMNFDAGSVEDAIANFEKAIQLDPAYADAYSGRGAAYRSQGQFDEALADFDLALELAPEDAQTCFERGLLYIDLGETEKAVADLNQALDLTDDPDFERTINDTLQKLESPVEVQQQDTDDDSEVTGIPLQELMESAESGAVACNVSAREPESAQVRVGPGSNRTALLWLPAMREFPVVGQNTAADGSLWWKLDPAMIPNKATEHFWVAQNQVIASGECDFVPIVEINKVIPITQDIRIQNGEWQSVITRVEVNCGGNVRSMQFTSIVVSFSVTMSPDQQSLILGDQPFTRTGPGTYVGSAPIITSAGVVYMDTTYRVESPQLIRGEHKDTDGNCSIIVYETLTRLP